MPVALLLTQIKVRMPKPWPIRPGTVWLFIPSLSSSPGFSCAYSAATGDSFLFFAGWACSGLRLFALAGPSTWTALHQLFPWLISPLPVGLWPSVTFCILKVEIPTCKYTLAFFPILFLSIELISIWNTVYIFLNFIYLFFFIHWRDFVCFVLYCLLHNSYWIFVE